MFGSLLWVPTWQGLGKIPERPRLEGDQWDLAVAFITNAQEEAANIMDLNMTFQVQNAQQLWQQQEEQRSDGDRRRQEQETVRIEICKHAPSLSRVLNDLDVDFGVWFVSGL